MSLLGHLERLIEGTLLSEMSQPASRADLLDRRFRAAELLAFDELYPETRFGLEKMGFEATDFRSDRYNERMDAWREEAREIGHEVPRQPDSVWRSEFETPDPALESKLSDVHAEMTRSMGTEVWGEQPGSPSKRMAEKLRQHFNTSMAHRTPTGSIPSSSSSFRRAESTYGGCPRWFFRRSATSSVSYSRRITDSVSNGLCARPTSADSSRHLFSDFENKGACPACRSVFTWCAGR